MQNLVPVHDHSQALMRLNPAGESPRQLPITLRCDWGRGTITVQAESQSLTGAPAYEWLGHQTTWTLPERVDACRLKGWIDERVIPLAREVELGYRVRKEGDEDVAFLTSRAKRHLEMLDQLFDWDSYKVSIPLIP